MSAGVFVYGWVESSYVDTLFDATAKPIVIIVHDLEIVFPNVVARITGMLHDGRFILARAT